MYRLYLGNLEKQVHEQTIHSLFEAQGLSTENIIVKDGYAFVDCPDQSTVDRAIDSLQGYNLNGCSLQVEPSMTRQKNGTRIIIRNIPQNANVESLREALDACGTVKEVVQAHDGAITVTFSTPEQALQAKEKLEDEEFQGMRLKVEFTSKRPGSRPASGHLKQEFPLRLLIPHQFVGAIIGRSGQTIRTITQKTNARVDVIRRDNAMAAEKLVMIIASDESSCTDACKEILSVMHQEAMTLTKREPELKILAHNNLCGRLIGKQGSVIKSIMEETKAVLTVSSVNNVNHLNPDRVVTVKGSLESVGDAAERIYSKLKAAHEADMQYNPQLCCGLGHPYAGLGGAAAPMVNCAGGRNLCMSSMPCGLYGGTTMAGGGGAGCCSAGGASLLGGLMTCYLYIPKASVGAVIGSKGSFINYVKSESHALCQVQEKQEEGESSERAVKIVGHPEAVWKAQWYIFDKIKTEGFTGNELAKLRCDVMVPRAMVGRIIGKGGQNVRHVQDISEAIIKLPDDPSSAQPDEVAVQIVGNIYAQTLAQSLIRQLLTQVPPPAGTAASSAGGAATSAHHQTVVYGGSSSYSLRSRGRFVVNSHGSAATRASGDAH